MSNNIDNNRIQFQDLNINFEGKDSFLLQPLKEIHQKDAASYKGVKVEVLSEYNQEDLVDITSYGIKSVPYYLEQAQYNPTYGENIYGAPSVNYARLSVCKKMQEVNTYLEELNIELICYDAHRSPETQQKLFECFIKKANDKGYFGLEAKNFALQYCSDPEGFDKNDPSTWTIHSTGAAVDVYLLDKKTQKVIDMGEGFFDNPDEITHTCYYEDLKEKRELTILEEGYLKSRRILVNSMSKAGFINFGNELFHYGYKDPYSAYVCGQKSQYGFRETPKII